MTQTLGALGEYRVECYLEKQGFSILARNFRTKEGELDIVGRKDNLIVCVEVKTRTTIHFVTSTVITPSKQKKIIKAAKYFKSQQKYIDTAIRFDVALYNASTEEITYIENAFYGSPY